MSEYFASTASCVKCHKLRNRFRSEQRRDSDSDVATGSDKCEQVQ